MVGRAAVGDLDDAGVVGHGAVGVGHVADRVRRRPGVAGPDELVVDTRPHVDPVAGGQGGGGLADGEPGGALGEAVRGVVP